METNYPAVICQGKQQRGRGGPGQAGDKQPSQATLFMAFLCISVFIWTFLSWRAGFLPHAPALVCCQLSPMAGYLPVGLPAKSQRWPGRVLPLGPGMVSVSLGMSLRPCPGLLLQRRQQDAGCASDGEVRAGCWSLPADRGGAVGSQDGAVGSGGLGAGSHRELCLSQGLPCFHGSLPSQQGALCLQ